MPMASDQRFLQQQFLRLCLSVGLTAGSLLWSIAAVGQAALQLIQVAADLKAMGFDMVSRANNHLFDSELEGMFATNALLDEAGGQPLLGWRTGRIATVPPPSWVLRVRTPDSGFPAWRCRRLRDGFSSGCKDCRGSSARRLILKGMSG